jgi:uncharacterized membrane protein
MITLLQCACETTTEPLFPGLPVTGMGWVSGASGGVPNWLWILTVFLVLISIAATIYLVQQLRGVQ